jgi:hypothetical protein
MKKNFLLLSVFVMLAGCSAQAADSQVFSKPTTEKAEAQKTMDEKEGSTNKEQKERDESSKRYVPNPQITDDRTLEKVGQSYTDDKGSSTLKAIKKVNKTYQIGDIELTIHDIKVIDHTPSYGMIDFFHGFTHGEEFDFIKVNAEMKNTSNQAVNFAPVAVLEMNTGEQKHFDQDIYLENLNGEIDPNGHKQGNIGFILEKPLKKTLNG